MLTWKHEITSIDVLDDVLYSGSACHADGAESWNLKPSSSLGAAQQGFVHVHGYASQCHVHVQHCAIVGAWGGWGQRLQSSRKYNVQAGNAAHQNDSDKNTI